MNRYVTYCEARACHEAFEQKAEDWGAAMEALRAAGWAAIPRPEGAESYCPMHRPIPREAAPAA